MRLEFLRHVGYWPNLQNPRSYSEILLKRLLKDDGREHSRYADKVEARHYVREQLGDQYLVPTLLVSRNARELLGTKFSKGIVVKSSAGSGMVRIIHDPLTADWSSLIVEFDAWLNRDYSKRHREKVYGHFPPQLLVEELLESHNLMPPADYKVYVFNGTAQLIQYISGRGTDIRQTIYYPDGRPMPEVSKGFRKHDIPPKPEADFSKLVWVAETLAESLDFVRVDLFWVGGRIYFGEMTFYPGAIRTEFKPRDFDRELGAVWLHGGHISDKWGAQEPNRLPNSSQNHQMAAEPPKDDHNE